MNTKKKEEGRKVATVTKDREKRTRKKAANIKGMEKGMTKGDHSSEQPAL
ncbi:hypothetical protein [Mucilaginibacter lacusdianchii]|nr:hypothetical protein [Mucilaginibacter sp. JXJ CY 39]